MNLEKEKKKLLMEEKKKKLVMKDKCISGACKYLYIATNSFNLNYEQCEFIWKKTTMLKYQISSERKEEIISSERCVHFRWLQV